MLTSSVAIVEGMQSGMYSYYITYMQTKILSQKVIDNLDVVRKDIGYEILKQMNEYRATKGLNAL